MTSGNPWDFDRFDRTQANQPRPSATPSQPQPAYVDVGRPSDTGFEADLGQGGGAIDLGRPPVFWIGVAAISATVALILGGLLGRVWLGGHAPFAWIGWTLAGPVAIGALALFTVRDTEARTRAVYARPTWVSTAYWGCLGLCVLAVVISALRLAIWAGSQ